jgi:uncharacterized repeat protein (TIGR01451 family)
MGSGEGFMYRVAALFFLLVSLAWAQAPQPLNVSLEAYIVTTITKDDGATEEQFSPAAIAHPGQIVEYRVVVVNSSDETLPGNNAYITGPIPASTDYLANTATFASAMATLEFSADGGQSFVEKPMVMKKNDKGEEVLVEAAPAEFTAARWKLLQALAPQETLTFHYRVTVQ